MVLEPFVNIDRDPANGRGWNTFGEDPLLTSTIGAREITGIQSQGTMAQVKHYIAYDGASGDVIVDQQTPPTRPAPAPASGPGAVPDCETRYTEGVDVGYRWYDRQGLTPLFPFGFGLSYTRFAYSALRVHQDPSGLAVTFRVSNRGSHDGDVTPQVYLGAPASPPGGARFAVKALAGFSRIHLRAGSSRTVTVRVATRQLQYWSTADTRWRTAVGSRPLIVASSARSTVLTTTIRVH